MTALTAALARARSEQSLAKGLIDDGLSDPGLWMAIEDWLMEETFIIGEIDEEGMRL